jgi:hypothetical protein
LRLTENATNRSREVGVGEGVGRGLGGNLRQEPVLEGDGRRVEVGDRTANRRSREAYNAYQREYMRKIRARS